MWSPNVIAATVLEVVFRKPRIAGGLQESDSHAPWKCLVAWVSRSANRASTRVASSALGGTLF